MDFCKAELTYTVTGLKAAVATNPSLPLSAAYGYSMAKLSFLSRLRLHKYSQLRSVFTKALGDKDVELEKPLMEAYVSQTIDNVERSAMTQAVSNF